MIAICDRCGKPIFEDDPMWCINQYGQYGSQFDGERVCREICDECLGAFLDG